MTEILLIEDDPDIIKLLGLHLCAPFFRLSCCNTGKQAFSQLSAQPFNLIILDIMLPDSDGLEICKRIRAKQPEPPILMLTARSEEIDKVLALELGADDYMTKPFGVRELVARVKALIRRSELQSATIGVGAAMIKKKNLVIDPSMRKVSLHGSRVELTPKEFDLLLLLALNPGKSFSREELLKKVWGYAFKGYEHTVTAHVNRLRLKIEPNLSEPQYILTAWGFGYRFTE